MRLINTTTLEFEEFVDESEVRYAILSHRWEKEEVTFQDVISNPNVSTMAGYHKILHLCAQARTHNLPHAWIDTCCIDKRSSAELGEAINSMFRWYQNATVCYAYLCDWNSRCDRPLENSEWFERGWTLQELIAPRSIEFFDSEWKFQGTRKELSQILSTLTRVPEVVLSSDDPNISRYSIAERMSWANGRKTTRIEDRAYSLLGLFGVNMSMVYGEGDKAFIRLQEEILRQSEDQSILAWTGVRYTCENLLAASPDDFPRESAERQWGSIGFQMRGAHVVTNKGLDIELKLIPWRSNIYLAVLNHRPIPAPYAQGEVSAEGIFVRKLGDSNYFVRVAKDDGDLFRGTIGRSGDGSRAQRDTNASFHPVRLTILRAGDEAKLASMYSQLLPSFRFHKSEYSIKSSRLGQCGQIEIIDLPQYPVPHQIKRVLLGFDFDWSPVIVMELEGRKVFSEDELSNVSLKQLESVTCMESSGWNMIGADRRFTTESPLSDLILPFKLSIEDPQVGAYQCEIYLGSVGESLFRCIMLILSRKRMDWPWDVALYETQIKSTVSFTGHTSWRSAIYQAAPIPSLAPSSSSDDQQPEPVGLKTLLSCISKRTRVQQQKQPDPVRHVVNVRKIIG